MVYPDDFIQNAWDTIICSLCEKIKLIDILSAKEYPYKSSAITVGDAILKWHPYVSGEYSTSLTIMKYKGGLNS